MANTFLCTGVTATTTFQKLSDLLLTAGIDTANNSVFTNSGYIKNNSTTINLLIGQGVAAPTTYATIPPLNSVQFVAGMNTAQVWISSASSTVSVDFIDGAAGTVAPQISGVIGTITLTDNVLPKGSSSNLVDSSITDDGTTVTATEPIISAHATTPYFETASGKTNTGYVNIKGKTSGAMKLLPADATAQTVTIATAAQTSGPTTLTIPDQAGVSSNFVFTTLAQTLTNKTLTAPALGAATATSINKVAITAPASSATLTISDGKTLAATQSLTLTGTDSTVMTFPTTSATIARTDAANTFTGTQTYLGLNSLAVGTTALAPLNTPAGTLKTTAAAGDLEFDGVASYRTNNTTSGRGFVPVAHFFRLTSTGSTISTIANYFGANSNIPLVASLFYEINVYAWFLNTTSGTVVWTLVNSAAPTSQNIFYEMSPVTGIVAPPGDAGMLCGQIYNDATATKALTATGALTDAVNHYMHMKIYLQNGSGTSLKIQATKSAGTITPGIGSYWTCQQLPSQNTGLFAA